MDLLLYALLNKKIKDGGGGGGSGIEVDPTLTKAGQAADAAVTGEKFKNSVGKKTTDGGEIFNDYEYNVASGSNSHAEGSNAEAAGVCAHAEGDSTTADGAGSHAEGNSTMASGNFSHAEGSGTTASGVYSHAEGVNTKASGANSHAEGFGSSASGDCSHAEGGSTLASSANQHVQGKFNIEDTNDKFAFIIGNGTDAKNRSNAFAVDWNGKIYQGNSDSGINIADLISGYLPLDGNAATATKLKTARTINGVPFDGGKNVNIPLQQCFCYDDSSTWDSAPWHKIASSSLNTAYEDKNLVLLVSKGYGSNAPVGILKLKIRSNANKAFESGSLRWVLAESSIPVNDVVAVYTNDTTNGKVIVELWTKISVRYSNYVFVKLAGHRRNDLTDGWTLYNSSTGVASHTSGTGTIVPTLATIQNPAQQTDSGWITLTPTSGASTSSIKCRKYGKTVSIRGYVVPSASGTSLLATTIPEDYRPSDVEYCTLGSQPELDITGCTARVKPTGEFMIGGTLNVGVKYQVNMTYLVD